MPKAAAAKPSGDNPAQPMLVARDLADIRHVVAAVDPTYDLKQIPEGAQHSVSVKLGLVTFTHWASRSGIGSGPVYHKITAQVKVPELWRTIIDGLQLENLSLRGEHYVGQLGARRIERFYREVLIVAMEVQRIKTMMGVGIESVDLSGALRPRG